MADRDVPRERVIPHPDTGPTMGEIEEIPGADAGDGFSDGLTDGDATVGHAPGGVRPNPTAGVVGGAGALADLVGGPDEGRSNPEDAAGIEGRRGSDLD